MMFKVKILYVKIKFCAFFAHRCALSETLCSQRICQDSLLLGPEDVEGVCVVICTGYCQYWANISLR